MVKEFGEEEYHVPFFDEYGFVRKRCPRCGEYFWTQNAEQKTCGEATSKGCAYYSFVGNSPTKKSYGLSEMREAFLSFFEKHGHERIRPYPVVARWRDDIYLTHASIIDFQPYVTEGIAPPPANPLVIVQPCIRLVDIDNTGPTFGRHLTIFEMGGHHAFNYPDKSIYWKDRTVRLHHEFVTRELGVRSEDVVYKEGVWSGGGNAGPDLESIVGGLEVATLVFMKFKVVDSEFVELPIKTVDTGYGIDRFAWLSQGTVSCFHAVYPSILDKVMGMAGLEVPDEKLLAEVARVSGMLSLDKSSSRMEAREEIAKLVGVSAEELHRLLSPLERVFAVVDHTKSLAFLLAEGVVPSNIQEGYLARLLFRRTYRMLKMLGISDKLPEIVDLQIGFWSKDYPHLKEMRDEILEMVSVEAEKFEQTLRKGENLVRRIAKELKARKASLIPLETLTELYDSHGVPPEIVEETARKEGVAVKVPENFYAVIAQRHLQAAPKREKEKFEVSEEMVTGLPETRLLFYEDQYQQKFAAKVIKVLTGKHVVLDQTCFYPEGGGQPPDTGHLLFDGKRAEVVDVQKVGKVVVHELKGAVPKENSTVEGVIDWEKRYSLMKHHTATHVLMGAARRVLGKHVWQFGTQKGVESSRLDISHYRRLTLEEVYKIEALANQAISRAIPVEACWMPRNEAERLYGFRLYQGGAIPGKDIRVVKIGDWDVEACAGTHLRNTGELGFIKILRTERIQDGVERLVYSAGLAALKPIQEREKLLLHVASTLNAPLEKLAKTAERLVNEYKETRKQRERLLEELAKLRAEKLLGKAEKIDGVKLVIDSMKEEDAEVLIKIANQIVTSHSDTVAILFGVNRTAKIVVMAGRKALENGVDAREIAREAASMLGGGGSGKPNFAQGGGTRTQKLAEATRKAEETLRRQIRKPK